MSRSYVITGASSGLGKAIYQAMFGHFNSNGITIFDWSLPGLDITDEAAVAKEAAVLKGLELDGLINCAGVNEVAYLPDLSSNSWDRVMDTNAKGIFIVTKALLENLRGGTVLNIVSNAATVPMTASAAYNASKGAAKILTAQFARELKVTHNITAFSISPGKLRGTEMSRLIEKRVMETRGWSEEEAKAYQLAALKAGEEIDPEVLAEFIAFLLSTKERHKYLAGLDIPYGG